MISDSQLIFTFIEEFAQVGIENGTSSLRCVMYVINVTSTVSRFYPFRTLDLGAKALLS